MDKGDYDNTGKAAMTLNEFEDWLHLEICRYHNKRHSGLPAPTSAPCRSYAGIWDWLESTHQKRWKS